jgi:hypothetical protein
MDVYKAAGMDISDLQMKKRELRKYGEKLLLVGGVWI